jgi:hypothetical protein
MLWPRLVWALCALFVICAAAFGLWQWPRAMAAVFEPPANGGTIVVSGNTRRTRTS